MSDVREFRRDTPAHLADHQRARLQREEDAHLHALIAQAARDEQRRQRAERHAWAGWTVVVAAVLGLTLYLLGLWLS